MWNFLFLFSRNLKPKKCSDTRPSVVCYSLLGIFSSYLKSPVMGLTLPVRGIRVQYEASILKKKLCVWVSYPCVYIPHTCSECPKTPEKYIHLPRPGGIDICELMELRSGSSARVASALNY